MKRFAWFAGIAAVLAMPSCFFFNDDEFCVNGQGDRVAEVISLPDFTGIKLNMAADVYIKQGPEQKVVVEAQQNIIDILNRNVRNGVWDIEFDRCAYDFSLVEVTITVPDLNLIRINASGDIKGIGPFDANAMEIVISGSGDLQMDLSADPIDATISGSGDIQLAGQTPNLYVQVSGSGDFRGYDLEAKNADMKISGSGNIYCLVTDDMKANISGSGDIHYKGFPMIDVNISGSGDLINEN
ncbi:MAG: DUF2807 domain-containing protein [Lewinellaceae bacterium]|nr:DUF2807 domain-containing protein [Lewinellaceae bacterium]